MNMPHQTDLETQRMRYAFWLAVIGLGLSVALVVFLILRTGMTGPEIVAIVGVFTSMTGTLVGAFFGVQIGSAGREQEREERRQANQMLEMAMAKMPPPLTDELIKEFDKMR